MSKIAKNLTFFQKNWQKLSFFSTKLPMAILLKKMTIFVNFFFKCQVFGNFLTFKWQFSRGSAVNTKRWQGCVQTEVLLGNHKNNSAVLVSVNKLSRNPRKAESTVSVTWIRYVHARTHISKKQRLLTSITLRTDFRASSAAWESLTPAIFTCPGAVYPMPVNWEQKTNAKGDHLLCFWI